MTVYNKSLEVWKNNLHRERDDADSCFAPKDKAKEGNRDHQGGGEERQD